MNGDSVSWKKILFYVVVDVWIILLPFMLIGWNKAKYWALFLIVPVFSQFFSLILRSQFLDVDILLSVLQTNTGEACELIMSSWKFLFVVCFISIIWVGFVLKSSTVEVPKRIRWLYLSLGFSLFLSFGVWHIYKIKKYDHRSSFSNCLRVGLSYARDDLSKNLSSFNYVDVFIEALSSYQMTSNYEHNTEQFKYDLQTLSPKSDSLNVIFVIGESSRVDHWSLFGYHRNTTPLLKDSCSNIVAFPNVYLGANLTIKSIPILISPATSDHMSVEYSSLPINAAYKQLGFCTFWFTSQKYSSHSIINKYYLQSDFYSFCCSEHSLSDDEVLVDRFKKSYKTHNLGFTKRFYVLHTMGSHFRYNQRCRKQFFKYNPTIDNKMSVAEMIHHKESMINSYDNTIVATDHLLYELYKEIQQTTVPSILVYVSDHGEMLGEQGVFLHGLSEPTEQEVRVPLLIQYNDAFRLGHSEMLSQLAEQREKRFSCNYFMDFLCKLSSFETQFSVPNTTFCDKQMSSQKQMSVVGADSKIYLFD